jgi:hypothetical protein
LKRRFDILGRAIRTDDRDFEIAAAGNNLFL